MDTQIFLYDMYEISSGVFDHTNQAKTKPLSSVAMHESEDNYYTSSLYQGIELYTKLEIREVFNLSLVEFMNLPKDIHRMVCEISAKRSKEKNAALSSVQSELNKLTA